LTIIAILVNFNIYWIFFFSRNKWFINAKVEESNYLEEKSVATFAQTINAILEAEFGLESNINAIVESTLVKNLMDVRFLRIYTLTYNHCYSLKINFNNIFLLKYIFDFWLIKIHQYT